MLYKYRPIKYSYWTQRFGANEACAIWNNGWIVKGKVNGVCPTGFKDFYPQLGMVGHNGTDWACIIGTRNYHPYTFEGWVKYDEDFDGGVGLDIVSYDPILKCNEGCPEGTMHYIKHRSWHLSERLLPEKTRVSTGMLTSLTGNTGASAGAHLHENAKWCDKLGVALHTNNGYYGAINEIKHPDIEVMDDIFVLDYLQVRESPDILNMPKELFFVLIQLLRKLVK